MGGSHSKLPDLTNLSSTDLKEIQKLLPELIKEESSSLYIN